jgi:hypothetical protein
MFFRLSTQGCLSKWPHGEISVVLRICVKNQQHNWKFMWNPTKMCIGCADFPLTKLLVCWIPCWISGGHPDFFPHQKFACGSSWSSSHQLGKLNICDFWYALIHVHLYTIESNPHVQKQNSQLWSSFGRRVLVLFPPNVSRIETACAWNAWVQHHWVKWLEFALSWTCVSIHIHFSEFLICWQWILNSLPTLKHMAAATKFGDVPSNPAGGRWFHFPTFRGTTLTQNQPPPCWRNHVPAIVNAAVRDCQSFKSINKNRLNYLWISISMICFDLSKSSSSSFGRNISLSFNHHRTQSFFLLIPRRWQGHNGHNGVVSFFLSEEPLGPRGILGLATDGATKKKAGNSYLWEANYGNIHYMGCVNYVKYIIYINLLHLWNILSILYDIIWYYMWIWHYLWHWWLYELRLWEYYLWDVLI